ncbi:transcription termination factor Tfs [Halovivax asiaticus JCM 14624]|uniref:Transcription factor S n=1 Tax=Halovivax asiaticus JCM 14624 TaxID=1227490 RepID=M0BCC0_9EURY|nr:transcription factor S [Halovivax asiaticus]ELZ08541.1 transcription termination factor Tfs [Halovivax asiaticus JCM 14624]
MQFCDECGSMMKPEGDQLVCAACGAAIDRDREREADFVTTETQTGDELIETEENADFEGKPKATDVRCDQCGTEEAWYYIQQTASADEPPTRFFKCTECGHKWRGYN